MGLNINYTSQGTGTPLVFQHGLTANIKQVTGLLSGLKETHLLSIDCPGHGKTVLPENYPLSFSTYADELISFLDRNDIRQAIFGGISMGSGIALNIGLRYPDRVKGLILVRPAWLDRPKPDNLKILLTAAQLMAQPDGQALFQQLPEFMEIDIPAVAQSVLGVFSEDQQPVLPQVIRSMVSDRPVESLQQLPEINVPCLTLGNDHDPLHPFGMAVKIHQSIPKSVLTKVTSRYIDNHLHGNQVRESIQNFILDNNLHL